jgi:hypothetical protein
VEVEGRSFGKLPGGEAELLRVMWWSGVQRNGRSTVRPRRLRGGGKKEAAALEIFGRCRARVRVQMGWGCSL